jgi:two-component system phosphate regulon sensor histidine kinase PhoR
MLEDFDQKLVSQLPDTIRHHIQQLERMRKDFVANVSHELRTPLTVIIGYLELLIQQAISKPALPEAIFKQMYQQALRMQTIIEDLLLLSRIENEEAIPVSDKEISISSLFDGVQQSAYALATEKKQELKFELDKKISIKGNFDELHSLFSNLIYNAIKYTGEHGTITTRWFKEDNHAVFQVEDTGIGIAPEHIPRLTERFYRVDKSRSRESGGTGLGLAIAKHILIRHHAHLEIQSELGKGSIFSCAFPLD